MSDASKDNPSSKLTRQRDMLLERFAALDREFDRRRLQGRLLAPASDINWEAASAVHPVHQEGHRLARRISPELGFNIHTFRVFQRQIAPGGVEGAFHTHGDAVKYYLSGEGTEIIGEDKYDVKAGDLAFIPANVWHGTENVGEEPLVFIAFHQIPGTQLPVPASWQYQVSNNSPLESVEDFLTGLAVEDPSLLDSATLYSRRQHILHRIGILEEQFQERRQLMRYVVPRDQVPHKSKIETQTIPLIAPELGFNIYALQVSIQIVPAGYIQKVPHLHGEAVHYFIEGEGLQTIGDNSFQVREGDLAFVPAGCPHLLSNVGPTPLRLFIAEQLPGTSLQVPTFHQEEA